MTVIDDYLKDVPSPQKGILERVRQVIKKTAPDAEEVITYGMPGFKYKKKYLIAFAPFKDHMSVFPGSAAVGELKKKLEPFFHSKGTIQFTLENPLPEELLVEMVKLRMADIDNG